MQKPYVRNDSLFLESKLLQHQAHCLCQEGIIREMNCITFMLNDYWIYHFTLTFLKTNLVFKRASFLLEKCLVKLSVGILTHIKFYLSTEYICFVELLSDFQLADTNSVFKYHISVR